MYSSPLGILATVLNILYTSKIGNEIPKTQSKQIVKRLYNKLHKTENEADRKKLKAIIDKISNKADIKKEGE